MKKVLKNSLLVTIMAVLLLSLVACGGNKLTATRETEEDGVKFKEELVITFKDDKAETVKFTYTFDNEDDAGTMYGIFQLANSMSEEGKKVITDLKLDGKKVTGQMSSEMLSNGEDESSLSKESIKKSLEEDGYKVK